MAAYRELAPSRDVYSLVACRWVRQTPVEESSHSVLILPDATEDLWSDDYLDLVSLA